MTAVARSAPTDVNVWSYVQEAVAAAATLEAARELGLLDRLRSGPIALADVAGECGIGERAADMLLGALCGIGIVAPSGDGTYTPVIEVAAVSALLCSWQPLVQTIRGDRPLARFDTSDGAEAAYASATAMLGRAMAPAAALAADILIECGPRVLDLGAGAAPWSLALALVRSDVQVTAVDLPAVLPAARSAAERAGIAERFSFRGGDLFAVDLDTNYDVVVVGNVCHLFGEDRNRTLLARALETLRPDGTLAIVDVLVNERLDGPRDAALYSLSLLSRTVAGRAYPFSAYMNWLTDVGYAGVERRDLGGSPPMSMITARRC